MLRFIQFFEVESAKLLLNHCWSTYFRGGSKYFNTYFEVFGLGGSIYFKVFGPPGGPFILEGDQILQNYSEVHGPGGPNTSKYLDWGGTILGGGGPFFS